MSTVPYPVTLRRATILAASAVHIGIATAQQPIMSPRAPDSAGPDTAKWGGLRWRVVGPFRGGRSVAVAGSAQRPLEYWMGTTGGGVFKTTDGGTHWSPMSDGYFGGSIGAIGVSASNPDIVYVGTGEYDIRNDVSEGAGVWKTTNGGRTWSHMGLEHTQHLAQLRVDPHDPNLVYAAALGDIWGPSSDRGVYKSTNGGASWQRVLFRTDSAGAADLAIDPADPNTLYASLWQMLYQPWTLRSGGPASGMFMSTDAGVHWTDVSHHPGLPRGPLGRISLAISPALPRRVWAMIDADSAHGLYRSDDAGATWALINTDRRVLVRPAYFGRIFADPSDSNIVYALAVRIYRSTDGGRSFGEVHAPHLDHHDLWIAPNDPARMIEGGDGGAIISVNRGETWTDQDYATGQMYHVTTTNHFPYRVCGPQQDDFALCGPSRSSGNFDMGEWYDAGGWENSSIAARPDDPDVTYGSAGGYVARADHRTGLQRDISVWPTDPDDQPPATERYRFQWIAPLTLSPFDPHTLYTAANVVFKTADDGQHWTRISPDLTRHDPATLGDEPYGAIYPVVESPVARGELWTGSDDGLVYISRDGGGAWTNVTPAALPPWTRIASIEPSHFNAGTAYLAANRYQLDDPAPYIYKTDDYGRSWTRRVSGLPATDFARVVREDPTRRGLLYGGTEGGVWVSFDDGDHWLSLQRNLPLVPVYDLAVADGDLVAATHGRSFWILDDLTPLRRMPTHLDTMTLHLFAPRDAYRVIWRGGWLEGERQRDERAGDWSAVGQNPPSGVLVYYSLVRANQPVALDILDSTGALIERFTSHGDASAAAPNSDEEPPFPQSVPPPPDAPNRMGLNLFTWDMMYPSQMQFPGDRVSAVSPMALPGTYWVRLRAAGRTDSAQFVIKPDPRKSTPPEALRAQFDFLLRLRDTLEAGTRALLTVRSVTTQLSDRLAHAPPSRYSQLTRAALPLQAALDSAREELYQWRNEAGEDGSPPRLLERLSGLSVHLNPSDGPPSEAIRTIYADWAQALDRRLRALQVALARELPRVNAVLIATELGAIHT